MKKQSIVGGFAILSICGLLAKLLSLVYVPVLNNILGKAGHGIYVATYGVFAFVFTICNSGLPNSISKLVSEEIELGNRDNAQRIFELSRLILIFVGLILSMGMFLFSQQIANMMNVPNMSLALKVLSPAVLTTAVLSSYKGYFQAQSIMLPTGISQVLEQVINVFFSLLVAAIFMKIGGAVEGVAGATTGTTLGAVGAILIMVYFYRKKNLKTEEFKYTRENDKVLAKRIVLTALPLTICAALQNASFVVDPWLLGKVLKFMGRSTEYIEISNSYIGKYQSLINVPVAIAMALAIAVLPVISSKIASGKVKEAKEKVDFTHKLCFLVSMPCAFGLMSLASPIASVFGYGEEVARLIMMGSFVVILMSLMQVQMAIMQGINKLYSITIITVGAIGIKMAINFFAILSFSFYGVIIGNGISFLTIVVLGTIVINRTLGEKIKVLSNAVKPFLASAIMGGCVLLANNFMSSGLQGMGGKISSVIIIIAGIIIGVAVYGILILLFKTISAEEYESMPGKIKKIIPRRFIK